MHGEANSCCIFFSILLSTEEGAHTYVLQHTISKVLFSPYDNTCIRMNMTYLSFARIDYRKVPTSLRTCEHENPIEQMSSYLSTTDLLIYLDTAKDQINTTSMLIDVKLTYALRSRKA
jgi:hypothetical protein